MTTMRDGVAVLDIHLHDTLIGNLTNVGGDRSIFTLDESYIENENRDTLSLSLKDEFGALFTDFRPVQKKIMPLFSNMLPEGQLRKYLADKADINPEREFFLLQALALDLPGAITATEAEVFGAIDPDALRDAETHEADMQDLLRFSLAGVQLKFSAIKDNRRGLTIPTTGRGGDWIVKLPSRDFEGVPENEFSMMTLAATIGMNVPEISLIDTLDIQGLPKELDHRGQKAFVIRRFDRLVDGGKLHIEDFAQVFNVFPDRKYERASLRNIAQVVTAEGTDDDVAELIRRIVFNTLIGNDDMHLKNWSLIYPDRRHARLAPAYDFLSTVPYTKSNAAALNVSRSKKFSDFTRDEISHLASGAAIPEKFALDIAAETVALFHEHWAREKKNLPMANNVRDVIDHHLKQVPIAN
jgi:serine/threonine-protein kinase HipA